MKRLAIIPTVFALVAMVAACADMTAPEVSPPQFRGPVDSTVPARLDVNSSPRPPDP